MSSVSTVTVIGPRGDSPSGSQNETYLTKATCLFMRNTIRPFSTPLVRTLRAAARIRSRLKSERNCSRPSRLSALPMMCLLEPSSETSRETVGNRLRIDALTFSSSSVGLTSALTVTSTLLSEPMFEKVDHLCFQLVLGTFIHDQKIGERND